MMFPDRLLGESELVPAGFAAKARQPEPAGQSVPQSGFRHVLPEPQTPAWLLS